MDAYYEDVQNMFKPHGNLNVCVQHAFALNKNPKWVYSLFLLNLQILAADNEN